MPYAVKQNGSYRAVTEDMALESDETFFEEVPQWAIDIMVAQGILNEATAALNAKTRQAAAQISAIQARIANLDWLINVQDPEEDPDEYIEPTAEDIAELAALRPRYTKWNSYMNKLGKVKAQATWPSDPVWPAMPELYNEEMSARAAVAS